ncbi:hypothetical protein TRIUR3_22951 [Triticum urartu]|uniref:Uncharacterized protein n=1 Tax=Triticum urartu TaxID=4572 RepID=M8A7Q6_TRIUA|nr:hypothetical protein TRIUR3_22951 [Triticum urartu]
MDAVDIAVEGALRRIRRRGRALKDGGRKPVMQQMYQNDKCHICDTKKHRPTVLMLHI